MCKFTGKSKKRILCKLRKSEMLRLYSIVHVAVETMSVKFYLSIKIFITTFFTYQVSACELQPFSCHDLANDIHSQTAKLCSVTSVMLYFTVCTCECEHSDGRLLLPQ